jgi:hypothetical protein
VNTAQDVIAPGRTRLADALAQASLFRVADRGFLVELVGENRFEGHAENLSSLPSTVTQFDAVQPTETLG